MFRSNQIIKILMSMQTHAYDQSRNKLERLMDKIHAKSSSIISCYLLDIFLFYSTTFKGHSPIWLICLIVFLSSITLFIFLGLFLAMLINIVTHCQSKSIANKLIVSIDHDENNVQQLSSYTEQELSYAEYWLQQKREEIAHRTKKFFGNNTGIFPIIGLVYIVTQTTIGFKNITHILTQELFSWDGLIFFGLVGFIGIAFGVFSSKRDDGRLLYMQQILLLAIKIRQIKAEQQEQEQKID